ncbi:hypothetical protein Poli38472_001471 [Pythium oligandrum]|uniref:G10 protein n=1 Tax=Pythium oligandrum TaxID=41045 RepID=A0A8K1FMF6_PYTOL|nr:hypothetical protein Poli38472_001471 [Pythium oligandrum]|eukprot:TMW69315.1 hypothetical protein Poli38472_001471 [Pythium oligandrum]
MMCGYVLSAYSTDRIKYVSHSTKETHHVAQARRPPRRLRSLSINVAMSKWTKKGRAPAGYDYIQPVMDSLEKELREKMNEPHEGKRKCEALWPVHQINWQRSRYVYDMYYKYHRISKEVYDYCIKLKLVDANLIAKWKKPGYERLCSTYAINTKNYNYGTVSICRVPRHQLSDDQVIQEKHSGCRGCASGPGGYHNIFGNKYGQYLARIQIEREKAGVGAPVHVWATEEEEKRYDSGEEDDDDAPGPMPAQNKRSHEDATDESSEEEEVESAASGEEEEKESEPPRSKKRKTDE